MCNTMDILMDIPYISVDVVGKHHRELFYSDAGITLLVTTPHVNLALGEMVMAGPFALIVHEG